MRKSNLTKLDDCIENILILDDAYSQLQAMNGAYKLTKKILHKNPKMSLDLADKLWDCKMTLFDTFLLPFEYKKTVDKFQDVPFFLIDYSELESIDNLLDFIAISLRNEYLDRGDMLRYYGIPKMEGLVFADMCNELSERVKSRLQLFGINSDVLRIYPAFSQKPKIDNRLYFHDFVMAEIDDKKYIVDLSYSQFFIASDNQLESLGIESYYQPFPGIYMLQDEKRLNVARTILERGWIEATDENIKAYFDGFALSFRNGLFYQALGKSDYSTPYTADDYYSFLYSDDSQLKREERFYLGTQIRKSSNPTFDYTSGTVMYENKEKKLIRVGGGLCQR